MKRPLILICNDDGIDSPFLPTFVKKFAEVGDIVIVVPAVEQSWIGRAYNRHNDIEVKETASAFGGRCFSVSGTPSDCVNIALSHICERRPDFVVSGLNIGHNLGFPLLWSSGTFSAAVEAAGFGIPSSAFSLRISKEYYEYCRLRHEGVPDELKPILERASAFAVDFSLSRLLSMKSSFLDDGRFRVFNVNFPEKFSEQTRALNTVAMRVSLVPLYKKKDNGKYGFSYAIGQKSAPKGKIGDWDCLESGSVSISEIIV